MPRVFPSHDFILRLAQQNQSLYMEALYTYRNHNGPFQTVHQQLSEHLNGVPNLIQHDVNVSSVDIWGNANGCTSWRKI
jgi:hypothetical protein